MVEDLHTKLHQMQQAASGGKPPGTILGILPAEINMGGQFKLEQAALFSKQILPGSGVCFGKSGGLGDKFLQAVQRAADEMKQCGVQAHVLHAGEVPSGNIHHGLDSGGFAARIEAPPIGPSIHHVGGGGRDF